MQKNPQITPENLPLPMGSAAAMQALVLYRDSAMLVLNKPAGIVVHDGAHKQPFLEAGFPHLQFGLPRKPALAHRLDGETSGCLVLGRHAEALTRLGKLFSENKAEKTYLALVQGVPEAHAGIIDAPILKSGYGSRWRISIDSSGKPAQTEYTVIDTRDGVSLLALKPRTGRTHQLRVHCAKVLHCPILGEPFYAPNYAEANRKSEDSLALHAWKIRLPYDSKRPAIEVTAPLTAPFLPWAAKLDAR